MASGESKQYLYIARGGIGFTILDYTDNENPVAKHYEADTDKMEELDFKEVIDSWNGFDTSEAETFRYLQEPNIEGNEEYKTLGEWKEKLEKYKDVYRKLCEYDSEQ